MNACISTVQFLEASEREAVLLLQGRCHSNRTATSGIGGASSATSATTTTRQGAVHAALLAANVIPISPLATPVGTPLVGPVDASGQLLQPQGHNASHAKSANSFNLDAEVDDDDEEEEGLERGGKTGSPSKKKAKKPEVLKQYQGRRNRPPAVHLTTPADAAADDEEDGSTNEELSQTKEMEQDDEHVEQAEEQEDEEEFEDLSWHFLKKHCGWTNRTNPFRDWVYLRPGQRTFDGHRESPDHLYFFSVREAVAFAKDWGVLNRGGMPAPRVRGGEVTKASP